MSDQANVDPKKLEEFAIDLRSFGKSTDRSCDILLDSLSKLGRSWEDPHYEKFVSEIRRLAITLNTFVGETEKYSKHLLEKAEAAKRIHN